MSGNSPYEYKFKGRFPALVVVWLMVCLLILLSVVGVYQGAGMGVVVFGLGGGAFFLLIGVVFFVGKANIFIDDTSISRKIAGKKFKVILWKDVERVAIFPLRGAGVKEGVIGYNILSCLGRSNTSGTKKIYFTSQGVNLSELIDNINVYIDKFNITVECNVNGNTEKTKLIPH